MSKLKTVEDLVSELNSEGARKDPVVVPDGKGQDGKRKCVPELKLATDSSAVPHVCVCVCVCVRARARACT